MLAPAGRQYITGPGAWGLALNSGGTLIVSANGGPGKYSLTVLKSEEGKPIEVRHHLAGEAEEAEEDEWQSVFLGLAFDGERQLYASEGNSGKVRLLNAETGRKQHLFDLNTGGFQDSYSGDLALDRARGLLYVLDQANFRLVAIDIRKRRILASTRVGRLPFSLALSPDGKRAYVTNIGMFQYQPLAGVDRKSARQTGLPFPAFGFPSQDAAAGAMRESARGEVYVPGLGDPNVPESNSLCAIDVEDPSHPRVLKFIRTGLPFGAESLGGSSPSGVVAGARRVFVSNGHNDSITVIDAATLLVEQHLEIRVPGLEHLRGVLPNGMDLAGDWLLVAESGINAIAVIDARSLNLLGHVPAGWFPARVQFDRGLVYVANAKGHGTGPNATLQRPLPGSFHGEARRGTISRFVLPYPQELPGLTARVWELNGFIPLKKEPLPLPKEIRHVVLIVKENRTFDEVFGDIAWASNGPVSGAFDLARFGRMGQAIADPDRLRPRRDLLKVNVTPNHHAMAERWAFSDNFYADSEVSVDGHHWLVGSYPNAWTESSLMASYGGQKDFRMPTSAPGRLSFAESNSSVHPEEQLEAGAIWHHLERHGISFRNFGEGFELAGNVEEPGETPTGARFVTNVPMPDPLYHNTSREYPGYNMNVPDQYRAGRFIAEVQRRYLKGGEEFPRFIFIHLPNDHMAKPRFEDGYPFRASFVADNDLALGRIVDFLSQTPWWRRMAILVTEDDAQGGVDHVDSHRTVLLVAGPYARKNFVSHTNSSFPGLLKTVFRLLGIPPLNLFDAAASDLAECFTSQPDFTPYKMLPVVPELFDPAKAREPLVPEPGPRLDDPRVLREQHKKR
jgi:DNA-binding beta-propeller fold protein YncE